MKLDVQGQGVGRILDVDGQGWWGGLENLTILMDVICVSSLNRITIFGLYYGICYALCYRLSGRLKINIK